MQDFIKIEQAARECACGSGCEPTEKQKIAGNYKKGRLELFGLPLVIENPRHSYRYGVDRSGKRWVSRMAAHYGYISKTKGADGDEVDAFIGHYPMSDRIFVINQKAASGSFGEHKVMLAFPDEESARNAYLMSFDRDWNGFGSIVECTASQLRWWLNNADLSRPLFKDNLPFEGLEDMKRVIWDDATVTPFGSSIDKVLYDIRRHDEGGLLFDSVTVEEILEGADEVMALDALVVPFARLDRQMKLMNRAMSRASKTVAPTAVQTTAPFRQFGTTNVAAVFEMSDGQTVSIYFHNPGVSVKSVRPQDDLVSWKWTLNKKDITVVVAPERGQDLNVMVVARRVMALAEKNSAAFQRANQRRAERMEKISGLKAEIAGLEDQLKKAESELELAKINAEERQAAASQAVTQEPESTATGYEEAKARVEAAQARSSAASEALSQFPRGDMGLTPDEVKATPEWQAAKKESEEAFEELRAANDVVVKQFGKEYKADREARRQAQIEAQRIETPAAEPAPKAGLFNAGDAIIWANANGETSGQYRGQLDENTSVIMVNGMQMNAPTSELRLEDDAGAEPQEADGDVVPEGVENNVKTAKGTQIATGFAVVEADDLIASHDISGNENPNYPQELQPRDRSRDASVAWVKKTAANLDPDSLGRTSRADSGAPIIGPDRVVESGNGRVMAIIEAYRSGQADEYREWLTSEAGFFGLSAEKIASMRAPVLVRVRTTDIDRAAFAVEANQDDKLAMTATEKAKSDANRLDDHAISLMGESGDLTASENLPFLQAFLRSLGDTEAAQYITSDGNPTASLIARVQAAIFAKAYEDERLLELTADVARPEIANIINALNSAAPEFIKARAANPGAANGAASQITSSIELSLDEEAVQAVIGAINVVRKARDSGMDVNELVSQMGLFEDLDPNVAAMAVFISKNNRSAKRLGVAFKAIAEFIKSNTEHSQTVDMFGETAQVSLPDVIDAANRALAKEYGEGEFAIDNLGLFDQKAVAEPAPEPEPDPEPEADPEAEPEDGGAAGDTMDLARRAIASADFKATTRDFARSIAVINGIDSGTERGMDRSLFSQSIVNKIKTRIKNDEVLGGVLLAWLHNEIKDMPRPAITSRNGVWSLTDWEQYTPLFEQSQDEPSLEPAAEPEAVENIEVTEISTDTYNQWLRVGKGMFSNVGQWKLFPEGNGRGPVLLRKYKNSNTAGGGYVYAEMASGFASVESAKDWASKQPKKGRTKAQAIADAEARENAGTDQEPTPMEKNSMQDPVGNGEKSADKEFLESIIDGSVDDILDPGLAERLEQVLLRNEGDADIEKLFVEAAAAYERAMMRSTESIA